jgi:hypothetical protein
MKFLYLGDSFINIFKLIQNRDIVVKKFKGKTAKGISKNDDSDGKSIIDTVNRNINNINCIIFNFGSVDVHFSYFHLLEKNNYKIKYKKIYKSIAKKYMKYIDSVSKNKNIKKIAICPYYSPIKDEYLIASLHKYAAITPNADETKLSKYISRERRNKIVDYFNSKINYYGEKYGIKVLNINDNISKNGIIDEKFVDISNSNIHLVYEKLIVEYIKLLNKCGVKEELIDYSQYDEYLIYKNNKMKENYLA